MKPAPPVSIQLKTAIRKSARPELRKELFPINNTERWIIQAICEGRVDLARIYIKQTLTSCKSEKDRKFCKTMLEKLEQQTAFQIPPNLERILLVSYPEEYREDRFFLRDKDRLLVDKVLRTYRTAQTLDEAGIAYAPTVMLHGASGCGKTELARYIAYKIGLPFVYVSFSGLVDSLLGKTQQNIGLIFNFIRQHPCVLCFDEIDAVGMARGQVGDMGEMNRIVIALMQEMDRIPNSNIIIATTNRFDQLDKALIRRFNFIEEVFPMTQDECRVLADHFFSASGLGITPSSKWMEGRFPDNTTAAKVIRQCTMYLVQQLTT